MPNWGEILQEIEDEQRKLAPNGAQAIDVVRQRHLSQLADYSGRTTICYYSGWLQKRDINTELSDEDKNAFMLCCHKVPRDCGLDLVLHTPGGDIFAAESIVYYLKQIFSDNIRCIVPPRSHVSRYYNSVRRARNSYGETFSPRPDRPSRFRNSSPWDEGRICQSVSGNH